MTEFFLNFVLNKTSPTKAPYNTKPNILNTI